MVIFRPESAPNALFGRMVCLFATLCCATVLAPVHAQEPSIERLLKKLPPPEKLVKPQIKRALEKPDPALKDPVGEQAVNALLREPMRALTLSRELVRKNPHSPYAHFVRGVAAMDMRQFGEAASAFRSSIAIRSDYAIVHLALGVTEMIQNHCAAALAPLEQAGKLESDAPLAWLLASACAGDLHRWQESLDLAKRATKADPAWVFTWIQLARAEKGLGHPQETLNAMIRAGEVAPDNSEIQAIVGFGYINLDRIPEAIPPLQRAARLDPKDYLIQSQLGFCLQATGQMEAGIDHLRKGAHLKSDYGPVWEHLGLAYQKQGRHDDAIKSFERATQLLPNSPLPWQHLAQEYRIVGRPADAERAAARARQFAVTTGKTSRKEK
jgi:tetratricopeptide (TPR) repeat protein